MCLTRLGPVPLAAACLLLGAAPPAGGEPWHKGPKDAARESVYPKAEQFGKDRELPGVYHAKYTTPDGVAAVVAWYKAKRLGFTGDEGVASQTGGYENTRVSVLADSVQPAKEAGGRGPGRTVELVALVQRVRGWTVSLVVSRAEGEDRTHIALTYLED
jgi:hypothetical protein